ncbi:hypothetical protein BDW02DRAFT_122819, partial [Decorospora gaudefroyi]
VKSASSQPNVWHSECVYPEVASPENCVRLHLVSSPVISSLRYHGSTLHINQSQEVTTHTPASQTAQLYLYGTNQVGRTKQHQIIHPQETHDSGLGRHTKHLPVQKFPIFTYPKAITQKSSTKRQNNQTLITPSFPPQTSTRPNSPTPPNPSIHQIPQSTKSPKPPQPWPTPTPTPNQNPNQNPNPTTNPPPSLQLKQIPTPNAHPLPNVHLCRPRPPKKTHTWIIS